MNPGAAANRKLPIAKGGVMSKGVVIGILALLAVGGLALSWVEVDAGCCCNPRVCASYIKGSGSPVGLVTGEGFVPPAVTACPAVSATSGGEGEGEGEGEGLLLLVEPPVVNQLDLRIVGDEGTNCGLGPDNNDSCLVDVAVQCGDTLHKKATTPGPLTITAGTFGQTNNGSGPDSANFTFQLSAEAKLEARPLPER
jgi:hypothetical protein